MMQRIDYWRGFTGGLLAGVAIGAWVYFSPRPNRKVADSVDFGREESDGTIQDRTHNPDIRSGLF